MDDRLVVVITGASSGIGRASALQFAQEGHTVVLASRNVETLEEVERECTAVGGTALAVQTDVTEEEQVESLAQKTLSTFSRIDVWVNNAAVTAFGKIEDVPTDVYKKVVDTNIMGYVFSAKSVLPHFKEKGKGTLINVSSQNGKGGAPYLSAYIATKFAIVGLSESLRQELLEYPDIHVCTVLPASIDTPLFDHAANYSGKEIKPLNPVYPPEEVAEAIVSLTTHPKREVYVGGSGKMMAALHKVAPGAYEPTVSNLVESDHFQDAPAGDTAGNVFEPANTAAVSGGWSESTDKNVIPIKDVRKKVGIALAAGALGVAGIAALALRKRAA